MTSVRSMNRPVVIVHEHWRQMLVQIPVQPLSCETLRNSLIHLHLNFFICKNFNNDIIVPT